MPSDLTRPDIAAARERLASLVRRTPTWTWQDELTTRLFGPATPVFKLELFQHAGSFKARGAMSVMLGLDAEARRRGVTAVSAGNHAIAVSWAAQALGTTAKVVMPDTADPFRVERCRRLGAEVELVGDVHRAFARAQDIERAEGRTFVHPFEGPLTALGTATLGAELLEQEPALDAVIVPIGGGGLAGGMAAAIKLHRPGCLVFGVEPEGNDTMLRSIRAGAPQRAPEGASRTIADSLSPPYTMPYSFGLCRRYLDDVVLVSDDDLRRTLALLFQGAKLAVEPAAAAATAALLGPLRERLAGQRVGLIVCGTNISQERYREHLARGMELLSEA